MAFPRPRLPLLLPVALAALLVAGCAQTPRTASTASSGTTSSSGAAAMASPMSDRQFAAEAGEDGLGEVAAGTLAAQKAQSPQVRDFGRQLMEEHSRNAAQLQSAGRASGIPIPATPGADEQAEMQKLQQASGSGFDRAFVAQMVKDHQEALAMYEREANQGADPNMRAYARQTIPALRDHLSRAQALQSQLGG